MGRYVRVEAEVPGLDTLEDLIIEHRHLTDLLDENVKKIWQAISPYNIKIKMEDTTSDNE